MISLATQQNINDEFEEINRFATLYLELPEGLKQQTQIRANLFGATKSISGEIVFQTGMCGYIESLTDPSYAQQLLVLTYPLIGNYGVPKFGNCDPKWPELLTGRFESDRIWPAALIVDRICEEGEYSHYEAATSLSKWLCDQGVTGLCGIDTRMLTKIIRTYGTLRAKIVIDSDRQDDIQFVNINEQNLVASVSRKSPKLFGNESDNSLFNVLAIDCGIKFNQIRCLLQRNCKVMVVPWDYEFNISDYDGLFISNGPGDPAKCTSLINRIASLLFSGTNIPIFGICLGHQLLASAAGANTYKMRFGNRGHNLPALHASSGRCFITAQNHGFAVDCNSLPKNWNELFINANDRSNEGMIHESKPYFSVQFHPEHCAGPDDTEWLFDVFVESMKIFKTTKDSVNLNQLINERLSFTTNYRDEVSNQKKVLILGSGGLSIGQAGEFDYSGSQAIKALREMGIKSILVNPNVATVQTTKGFADRAYFLPVTKEFVTEIIKKERPTGLLCTFGGQTALNCAIDLFRDGVLKEFNVRVLGTPIEAIVRTEDRDLFKHEILKIGERVAEGSAATNIIDAEKAAEKIGYPVLVRAAYALGGLGSGFATNKEELNVIAKQAFAHSNQVLIDKSIQGWKEIEYEVVRDAYDNCISVCNMENIDPVGIHTGESIVVAPSQTLNDHEYFMLRATALRVIRHFGIIGECNIQFALNPENMEYYIIEVNARLSRSSALASKATGYPLAYIAAKLALGASLPELQNSVTGETTACFEPSLDYCVVKVPRWDLGKFARVSTKIGSSMKSVGEVMAIGRSFEEAFQKALRMVNDHYEGFSPYLFKRKVRREDLQEPTDLRIFALARTLFSEELKCDADQDYIDFVYKLCKINKWFLHRMRNIVDMYKRLQHRCSQYCSEKIKYNKHTFPALLKEAKQIGFSDAQIAKLIESTELNVKNLRKQFGIFPYVKQIDTVAAEWPAKTNYLYLTYNGNEHDIDFYDNTDSVIVLGSGVYRIGSSVEFDACSVGCVEELKRMGRQTIMINCNPETVSTDYDKCDRLYFEEISLEVVSQIYEYERPSGIILAFGGQAANNIALSLDSNLTGLNFRVFGTAPKFIDEAEDRFKFSRALDELKWKNAKNISDAKIFCNSVGFPCLIRPSYVLSGAAMNVAHCVEDLHQFLNVAHSVADERTVVVSKFIENAKEIDVDVVCLNGKVLCMAISEHVENAGIHSGDATLVTPPQDLNEETRISINKIVRSIARRFMAVGPFNLQLIAKDNKLFVIECNLRVSRSFPFISKTLDFDFVGLATRAMMFSGEPKDFTFKPPPKPNKFGVKVPQFSFSRLSGADVVMGVEMLSTGEVACFGLSRQEAYLKGLLSTGFQLPTRAIFLSIGGPFKSEMLESVQKLFKLGYVLYGSKGTAHYYSCKGIPIKQLEWPFDDITSGEDWNDLSTSKMSTVNTTITDYVAKKNIDFMINLPIRGSGTYRVSAYRTRGYKTRRMAIDNGIPLITDIKCAKLFIQALNELEIKPNNSKIPPVNLHIDSISNECLVRMPGLIDVHVHMREPGGEHKETWESGTRAAISGGVTMVLAMPNTNPPLIDDASFTLIDKLASSNALCDYALYMGATMDNVKDGSFIGQKCAGLKMYLNQTFAVLQLPKMGQWMKHMRNFPSNRPIVVHAEGQTLAAVLYCAKLCKRALHICHVSTSEEINLIRSAKIEGQPVTCEVCPHHLFLTADQLPEGVKEVRPRLAISVDDCKALWENLEIIDCFSTDHAPHTWDEKCSANPPPGFPGIEYMLPLLLQAVKDGKLTEKQLIDRLYTNPRRIFELPEQPNTYIEVDKSEIWRIPKEGGFSKAGWTPFAGREVCGRVKTVVIRGVTVYVDGQFLVSPGFGTNVRLASNDNEDESAMPTSELLHLSSDFKYSDTDEEKHLRPSPDRPLNSTTETSLWYGRNVISVESFTKPMVKQVLDLALRCEKVVRERSLVFKDFLRQFIVCPMFFEPSTRTKCSFECAMKRLDGEILDFRNESSSEKKGETFEDTIQTIGLYTDLIVLRHPSKDACELALQAVSTLDRPVPIINAGDGTGEHPTQALLDLYTIREKLSSINHKTIAIVGDLKYGRTVHSLAKILCLYDGIILHYVSPSKSLGMPEHVKQYVEQYAKQFNKEIIQKEFTSLEDGIHNVDVIYMTRIQKERFTDSSEYEKIKGKFILTPKLLNMASTRTEQETFFSTSDRRHPTPIVMHPLPRNDEISTELDTDERVVFMKQAGYGLYVRMALLTLVLRKDF
uniref:Carbamoyl phosphate synthase arginine-specific large chain n=1 Tax=Meloidogyne javanica TaxID=6303 RepID=A0A915LI66_MELJA